MTGPARGALQRATNELHRHEGLSLKQTTPPDTSGCTPAAPTNGARCGHSSHNSHCVGLSIEYHTALKVCVLHFTVHIMNTTAVPEGAAAKYVNNVAFFTSSSWIAAILTSAIHYLCCCWLTVAPPEMYSTEESKRQRVPNVAGISVDPAPRHRAQH